MLKRGSRLFAKGEGFMVESEFGNISWVYYVVGAYTVVAVTLLVFALNSLGRYKKAVESLNEETPSDDKNGNF
jgi:hypothetical protein